MNRKNEVCYDKKTIGKEGYLVTLYRYTNNNADEQTIVMRFDPNKVDGHAVQRGCK